MTKINRLLSILLFSILFFGCKKSQTPVIEKDPNPISREIKSIEVLSGNNQLGYKAQELDTILVKVKLSASDDKKPLAYSFQTNDKNGMSYVYSQNKTGDDMLIKLIWQPSGNEASPVLTFYVSATCSNNDLAKGTCNNNSSVKINATFRQPWQNIYKGSQAGYNVLYDLYFIDNLNGIAVGEGSGIIRTTDGGKSWIRGESPQNGSSAYIISFTSRDTALINIVNNYSLFTYDGGRSFVQPTDWTPPFVGHRSSSQYYLQTRNIIYTVGWHGNIGKTLDGGKTWDKSGSFNILNNLAGLTHIGNDTLFTCGSVGFVARTTNAGKTWEQQPLQLNANLNTIYFINNKFGFAGGQYGALIRTTDAGEHWNTISTPLSFPIISIRFFKNGHGFLVSSGGEIAESKDNGLSWTLLNKSNYGAGDLLKAVIKDEKSIYGVQQSSILTYNLTSQ